MSLALHSPQTLGQRNHSAVVNTAQNAANTQASARTAAGSVGVNSTELLRGQKAVEINHNGFVYRLQATRLGKLILTK